MFLVDREVRRKLAFESANDDYPFREISTGIYPEVTRLESNDVNCFVDALASMKQNKPFGS